MNPFISDIIGYLALVMNLYSMSSKGEYKLRVVSSIANAIYVLYGFLIEAIPIILGCSIAVCLHLYRLKSLNTTSNDHRK
ncbi:hypothetical protein DKG77_14555 [Flagellimonas aquimarina]|jgi:hypothetical protein|uniref:Inner membrane protein n=1 Tax=Flagellimonas aquimarina TaxID=2201895 RepID=A0A316KWP3_9FLAO|nr:YgjV family protein [Allomuricauda koreensis]PWL37528.1 hypothetical protein DKG77_14555 [Allomuricauda koreensis]